MRYTITDIAKRANVSKATVSRVINNKSSGVGEETKKRILDIIKELDYHPNTLARSIVVSSTKTIGLIIPDITNPFFPQLVRGIVDCANEQGYTVFLCNSDNNTKQERHYIQSFIEKSVDGVIIASNSGCDQEGLLLLQNYNIPVVQVDRITPGVDWGASICIDNTLGIYESTKYLLDAGHRRIAFLGGAEQVSSTVQRYRGYLDAYAASGLVPDKSLVRFGSYSIMSGVEMMEDLLNSHAEFTGVIAGCDLIAVGAVKAMKKAGIQIPSQCEIIGFDGIELSEIFEPSISTVAQPILEIAQESAKLLLGLINGTISNRRHIIIEPELVLRNTTK